MASLRSKLAGKKTYAIAFVIAVLNIAVALGYISVDNLQAINVVLGALGLGALRASVPKA